MSSSRELALDAREEIFGLVHLVHLFVLAHVLLEIDGQPPQDSIRRLEDHTVDAGVSAGVQIGPGRALRAPSLHVPGLEQVQALLDDVEFDEPLVALLVVDD
eukprot:CAMPEP_0198495672 /NCGR_PEP_ID=MMETSP1462-20131121/5345_1 /TAXON_ID=1333877 /ORGANISM="Brandtodinium nutriculum, Strain RCC3387" /LENGTH=101 /DNA_ID=CAMNT_0044224465 /DNA_START=265 /DNA_END=567 /DNA_ORIENTATION=+